MKPSGDCRFWSHLQGAAEGLIRRDVGRHGHEEVHAGAVRGQGVQQRDRVGRLACHYALARSLGVESRTFLGGIDVSSSAVSVTAQLHI